MENMLTVKNLHGDLVTVSEGEARFIELLSMPFDSPEMAAIEKEVEACKITQAERDELQKNYHFSK